MLDVPPAFFSSSSRSVVLSLVSLAGARNKFGAMIMATLLRPILFWLLWDMTFRKKWSSTCMDKAWHVYHKQLIGKFFCSIFLKVWSKEFLATDDHSKNHENQAYCQSDHLGSDDLYLIPELDLISFSTRSTTVESMLILSLFSSKPKVRHQSTSRISGLGRGGVHFDRVLSMAHQPWKLCSISLKHQLPS